MELIKQHWTKSDIEEFEEFENTLKGDALNCEWEQRIVNTKLECFARTSSKAREVAKQIKKGAYLEFLDNISFKTHFDTIVSGYLINMIKDFETYESKLDKYIVRVDNWASVDILKFNKQSPGNLLILSRKYLKSDKPFVRRLGVNIWFELIKDEEYISQAFDVLDELKDEKEYYVNMSAAWLLAECMAKSRDKTIDYFGRSKTNPFVINKAISKCRDSFRVSVEDKEYLVKFKIKQQKIK